MPVTSRVGPWMELAGGVTAGLGIALVVASRVAPGLPLMWIALAVVAAGLIELAAGIDLRRRGAAWMAHVFSGVLISALALYLLGLVLIDPRSVGTPPVALVLGVFCLANAVFRGLDLVIDAPPAAVSEALDVGVTFVAGVLLVALWRVATPPFVALVAGVELIAGGLSLLGTVRAAWLHPEQPSYSDRPQPAHLR